GPGGAAVAGDVDQPVVGAGPEQASLQRRLRQREDRAVVLGAGVVDGKLASGAPELLLVVACQVRTDRSPALSLITGARDADARLVQRVGVVRRDHDRRRPVEAIARIFGAGAAGRLGPDVDRTP